MAAYKEPSLEERTALAQKAKEKALKKLASKPPVDEAELARRTAARLAREAATAEKSRLRREAIQQAKAEKLAASLVPEVVPPTEAELKAARDEKYAARKKRKK